MDAVDEALAALDQPERTCLERVITWLQGDLDGFSFSKGTIHFMPDHSRLGLV
ncbi:hypothetical protein [Arthrobacter sp. TMN-50]